MAAQAFARRGYGAYGQPTTFISEDRADNQPLGWARGWFEDGEIVNGHALSHVMDPSWRVRAPIASERDLERMLEIANEEEAGIEDLIAERRWEDRREGAVA